MRVPNLPLPDPLRGLPEGTWAHDTIVRRLPATARRVIVENNFPPAVVEALNVFADEIPEAPIRFLGDGDDWDGYLSDYVGKNWLDAPWFVVETYFYRRILEATGYFVAGETEGVDPFAYQKELGFTTSLAAIATLSEQVGQSLTKPAEQAAALHHLLGVDLWGNRADLSLWPADEEHGEVQLSDAHLLVDDRTAVVNHLLQATTARVDIVADNAGFELVADLLLADYLLSSGIVNEVVFHLKCYPTFVSDATILDVQRTIGNLAAVAHRATAISGQRLSDCLANGRLRLTEHPFWTSPLAMWQMADDVRERLRPAQLIMSKGDANYRRLLGDRAWPFTTEFADIVSYMPSPTVALRTYKSEVGAGLTAAQLARLDGEDEAWRINGRWGVVQWTG